MFPAEIWDWIWDHVILARSGAYMLVASICLLIYGFINKFFHSHDDEVISKPIEKKKRVAPERNAIDELPKSLPNENVKREALKLRDLLLQYDRKEYANSLEQYVAELDDPNTVEKALRSLDSMCHVKWLGDVYLPEYDQGRSGYEWLAPLRNAVTKALRRYR